MNQPQQDEYEVERSHAEWAAQFKAIHERAREAHAGVRRQEAEEWWALFKLYLASVAWEILRLWILRRRRECEATLPGCTQLATQCHHLSYREIGNEPQSHLYPVCVSCHDELTKRERSARIPPWDLGVDILYRLSLVDNARSEQEPENEDASAGGFLAFGRRVLDKTNMTHGLIEQVVRLDGQWRIKVTYGSSANAWRYLSRLEYDPPLAVVNRYTGEVRQALRLADSKLDNSLRLQFCGNSWADDINEWLIQENDSQESLAA